MVRLAAVLSDDTSVSLEESTEDSDWPFYISVNGCVDCRYDTFQFAWEDFGRIVRCASLEEVKRLAND